LILNYFNTFRNLIKKIIEMNPKQILSALIISCILATGLSAGDFKSDTLMVCLMGDPQLIHIPETPRNVEFAMTDLAGLDHDFLAVLGDLSQNHAHFYDNYKEAVLDKSEKPVYSLAGNGDVGAGIDAYLEAIGLPLYYSFYRRGIRFVFLSTISYTGESNHICHLGMAQMKWLRKELRSDTLSTTILFSHPPVFETTYKSEERDHLKPPGSMYLSESLEMRELLRLHPNVKVFAHGHLHYRYGTKDDHGRGGYFAEGSLLHISVGGTCNNNGSSFLLFEKDKITVRVRDHEHQQWRDEFQYNLDIPTTLTKEEGNLEAVWNNIDQQIHKE
jgi:hypothetical protein